MLMEPVQARQDQCPICGSTEMGVRFRRGPHQIMECRRCGGGFALPRLGVGDISDLYGGEYGNWYLQGAMHEREFARRRFTRTLPLLLRHCPEIGNSSRRVLDIGCGSGRYLSEFRDAGWQVTGVDLSPPAIDFARNQLGLEVVAGDILTVDLPLESFDLVTMFEVIEHAIDPKAMVARCWSLLARGGAALIETPNYQGAGARVARANWAQLTPPLHLNFFTVGSLARVVRACGFTVALTRTIPPQGISRLARWPAPLRWLAMGAYRVAPRVGMGATVQILATKSRHA